MAELVDDGADAAEHAALQAFAVETVEVVIYAAWQFRVRNLVG